MATSTDPLRQDIPHKATAAESRPVYRSADDRSALRRPDAASDSFRLVGPGGVVEARRPDEVAGVIAAAEGAAARGSWVAGFVAYEAAPGLDPALAVRRRDHGDAFARLPLAWFAMFEERATHGAARGRRTTRSTPRPIAGVRRSTGPTYDAAIARIREHIAAGDTYQVNHTLRLRSRIEGDERGLYRDLCYAQRGAYAAYLNLGRYRVLSASPELFFRIDDGRITTKPMKGTARRGRWSAEDDAVAAGLRGSVKDRAENAMIVDMLRNDMGRVARTGSVTWSDVFDLERYETVWQLTSTVSADLEPATTLADVFRGLFPSGSVTGAPKVRTMEIIADLEDSPRGVYCGAVGFLAPPGSGVPRARFNVPIRTVMLDTETHAAEYGVGGGITWGSSAAGRVRRDCSPRLACSRRDAPGSSCSRRFATIPREGSATSTGTSRACATSSEYFGFPFDEDQP